MEIKLVEATQGRFDVLRLVDESDKTIDTCLLWRRPLLYVLRAWFKAQRLYRRQRRLERAKLMLKRVNARHN